MHLLSNSIQKEKKANFTTIIYFIPALRLVTSEENVNIKPVEAKSIGGGYGYGYQDNEYGYSGYGHSGPYPARNYGGSYGHGYQPRHLVPIQIPYIDRNGM